MILGMHMRKSLGPYQLVRRIGFGGMAEVHLAIAHGASGFQRTVAIKTLLPSVVGEAAYERGLIREAQIAGNLHHRNLVYVHGFGVEDGLHYMVMEYVDGGDLADAVLPEPLALHVACELALGLQHLHEARDERGLSLGLVHRDLSPSNVLVSTTGDVKLADFGIAKATAHVDLTASGARRGTYAYMAPEQLEGEAVTPATDQFALAVTLAELVTGERVFAGEAPWQIMEAIRADRGNLTGLAEDLAAVVRRATAPSAPARFASIDELRVALEAIRRTRPPAGTAELAAWARAR
jgi:serine/threonine-protein kinase